MADESDPDDTTLALLLIAGGVGLFFGASFVEDKNYKLVMKGGGIVAAVAGIFIGGKQLAESIGLGSLFGGDKKPKVVSTDKISKDETEKAQGSVSGEIITPTDGAHLDPGALQGSYPVEVRVFNDTTATVRVRVDLTGEEIYAVSANEPVGTSLGEVTLQPGQSKKISGSIGLGSWIHLPFASPDVELCLYLNGEKADKVAFTYD